MKSTDSWTTRPHPVGWTENTLQARGMMCDPMDPRRTVAAAFAWGAVLVVGAAATVAGGMLAVAKWLAPSGDR